MEERTGEWREKHTGRKQGGVEEEVTKIRGEGGNRRGRRTLCDGERGREIGFIGRRKRKNGEMKERKMW